MNELLLSSTFFGVSISLLTYFFGMFLRRKFNYAIVNPLLISAILTITFLLVFDVDYATYNQGAQYLTIFLTPATICLAVPLYRQLQILKQNVVTVIVPISCGVIAHAITLVTLSKLFNIEEILMRSLLSKSVTTPIAVGICHELNGIEVVTIMGVMIAGIIGAVFGPIVCSLLRIKEPIAQGLGIGSASHAIGTSKALEMGEIQGAMSSLAIVVTAILNVIVVPIIAKII
ncbi:MAG: LrgB family protein [Roseburia sp.]|nr:LrgB family protein [Roseburia sp.]